MRSTVFALCWPYDGLRDLKIKTWKERHACLGENELRKSSLKMRRDYEYLKGIHK